MKYIEYLNELIADIALLIHRLLYPYFKLIILAYVFNINNAGKLCM